MILDATFTESSQLINSEFGVLARGEKGEKGDKGDKGDPGYVNINDSSVAADETWSSQKIEKELTEIDYSPAIELESKGEVITLKDSSNRLVRGLNIYGKTTQVTTTGKNLLDFEACLKTWNVPYTKEGEKYTIPDIWAGYSQPVKFFEERKTVSVQAVVKNVTATNGRVEFGNIGEDGTFTSYANLDASTVSNSSISINAIRLNYSAAGTFTVENIQVELGSTATAYEPYTGGKPAPNPDYPQELESVGESKNLFNKDDFTYIKAYVDGNGLITGYSAGSRTVLYISCAPNTTYTASRTAVVTGERFGLGWTEEVPETGMTISTNTNMQVSATIGNKITHTITTGATAKYLVCYLGWTNRNQETETLQIEIGDTATPYKPYQKGNIGVTVLGKNLIPYPYVDTTKTVNGITFTDNGDGTITANGTATAMARFVVVKDSTSIGLRLPIGAFTLSGCPVGGRNDTYVLKSISNNYGLEGTDYGSGASGYVKEMRPCTGVQIRIMAGVTVNNLVFKPQIEKGTVATAYEPYKAPQTLTAQTPNGLPGIPVSSGGNYTDESGQQWICDEVDFAKGVYVKRVGTKVFDGTENWYKNNSHANTQCIDGVGQKRNSVLMCNQYKNVALSNISSADIACASGSSINVKDPNYAVDVVTWKAHLAEMYAAGNPLIMYFELATPTEKPLSAEELAQYAKLHANKPNTTVFNDANAYMELDYVADTKTYIDQKIAEISAAMLNA